MHIVERAPDRLVLHDSPWGMRGMGALFAAAGGGILAAMIVGRHSAEHNAWVAFVVGGAFGAIGLIMLLTAADRRIIFDGPGKLVRTIRRGLLGTTTMEYPFAAIRDIALEASDSVGSGRTSATSGMYRIVFVLRDGTRVPWTSVLTGDMGTQAQCVAAARRFGGWDSGSTSSTRTPLTGVPTVAPTPTPTTPRVEPRRPTPLPVSAIFGGPSSANAPNATAFVAPGAATTGTRSMNMVAAFLVLFALVGVVMAVLQAERLILWRPVPAVVMSSTVESVRSNKGGATYRPEVTYRYVVDGRPYVSGVVSALSESRSYRWATTISQRYQPGATVTAYVDPGNPGRAFLVHRLSVFPFIIMAIPIFFGAVIRYSTRWSTRQADMAAGVSVPVVLSSDVQPPRAA